MPEPVATVTRHLACPRCGDGVAYTATIRLNRRGEGPVIMPTATPADVENLKAHTCRE